MYKNIFYSFNLLIIYIYLIYLIFFNQFYSKFFQATNIKVIKVLRTNISIFPEAAFEAGAGAGAGYDAG